MTENVLKTAPTPKNFKLFAGKLLVAVLLILAFGGGMRLLYQKQMVLLSRQQQQLETLMKQMQALQVTANPGPAPQPVSVEAKAEPSSPAPLANASPAVLLVETKLEANVAAVVQLKTNVATLIRQQQQMVEKLTELGQSQKLINSDLDNTKKELQEVAIDQLAMGKRLANIAELLLDRKVK